MLHAFMRYDSNAYNESSNPEVSRTSNAMPLLYSWCVGDCISWGES